MKTDRRNTDGQAGAQPETGAPPAGDAGNFDRSFKCAVIAYAVVEFIAIALVVYCRATR
jgi:hypothetical protein